MTAIGRGTAGDDNLTGTSGNDNIPGLRQGGNDTVDAGDGNDVIRMGASLDRRRTKIDGGTGKDAWSSSTAIIPPAIFVFNARTRITNVEVLEPCRHGQPALQSHDE